MKVWVIAKTVVKGMKVCVIAKTVVGNESVGDS